MTQPRLVGVLGAKGGCGTTLLTASLAASLAQDRRVCAIDLDFGKGDLAASLDVVPVLSVPELIGAPMDPTLLRGAAARHACGLSVLGQPKDMTLLARPTGPELERLFDESLQAWELCFVDLGSRVDEAVIAAVRRMDRLVLLTSDGLISLRDAGRMAALLGHAQISRDKWWLVLNHLHRHAPVRDDEIEPLLHTRVDAALPFDGDACDAAALAGTPIWDAAPRSPLSHALLSLWNVLLDGPAPAPRWHLPWLGGER